MTRCGFPPSEIPVSTLACQLDRAYRRLLRPSSPPDAKASTACSSQLNPIRNLQPDQCSRTGPAFHHPQTVFQRGPFGLSKIGSSFVSSYLVENLERCPLGLLKGGDPAAGSPTATLLRLHPNHQTDRWRLPPCGRLNDFRSIQLSWCDGRCVQGPGTYSPRHSDPRLLAIPTSRSRVADCDPN